MLIFLNGSLVPQEEARVSVLDRGFLYGDGVFETLRAYSGKIFRPGDHLHRLFSSANSLLIKHDFTSDYLENALYKTLRENNLADAYLRLTITRGQSGPGPDIEDCSGPTLTITAREFRGYPEDTYQRGISAVIVNTIRIPASALNPQIKSLNFLNNIMARIEAKGAGASEAFMLNTDGYVAEGTVSNIFIVKDGIALTAPLSIGILDGVTRSQVTALAQKNNIRLMEYPFRPEEILSADECFITSTLYEVMPVTSVNHKQIGNGNPGNITLTLLGLYRTTIY